MLLATALSVAVLAEIGAASAGIKLRLRSAGSTVESSEISTTGGAKATTTVPAGEQAQAPAADKAESAASGADDAAPAQNAAAPSGAAEAAPGGAPPGPAPAVARTAAREPAPRRVEETISEPPPHPLAVANPDHNVITCVAGCYDAPGRVVHFKKRVALLTAADIEAAKPAVQPAVLTGPVAAPAATPAVDAAPAGATSGGVIECLAGCYGSRTRIAPMPGTGGAARVHDAAVPSQASGGAGVGEWLTTVRSEPPAAAAPARRAVRSKSRGESGQWFRRRFETPATP